MNDPALQPAALPYQETRGLDRVPAYATGLQALLHDGRRAYLALSATELAVYFDDDVALHYDLEGRLVRVAEPHQSWRRSLSHRGLHSRKRSSEEGGGLDRAVLTEDAVDWQVQRAHTLISALRADLAHQGARVELAKPSAADARAGLDPLLDRAARFDVEEAHRDAERFHTIYGRVAVLPPDQYNALVLQATEGCRYAGCLFCDLYQEVEFHARSAGEFSRHVDQAVAFHGASLRSRSSIFLGEANALTLPQAELVEIFQGINDRFELPPPNVAHVPAGWWLGSEKHFSGVASFMDVFTGQARGAAEFLELRRLGLRRVYIGLETGDDTLLRWLKKPAHSEAAVRNVRNLKSAGIAVGVIVLLGAGGRPFAAGHERETVRVLNDLRLGAGDAVYFSPLTVPENGCYAQRAQHDCVEPLPAAELQEQEKTIRRGLQFDPERGRPYVARYELERFIY